MVSNYEKYYLGYIYCYINNDNILNNDSLFRIMLC